MIKLRIQQTLSCKKDCFFERLFSNKIGFISNIGSFITSALAYLPPEVGVQCRSSYSSYIVVNKSADSLVQNLG